MEKLTITQRGALAKLAAGAPSYSAGGYRVFRHLTKMGLVVLVRATPAKLYALTDAGRTALAQQGTET